ncbi:MAG: substrate-binding domain-containing protein [Bacteroidota bacterium]|uniref:substrate-binding domain-containing protein n=1 Tax=Parabacteroides sp. FAFU027 TaxID=2922715 RepID=UPI001FAE9D03|nr:substrate-binding domain-containing protein [Parabacteroides sp. FAFU027]MDP4270762.1 substrate-binding domain-containing protein [Bacteroidota bacterium]
MKKQWFLFSALSLLLALTVSCKKVRQSDEVIIAVVPKVDNAIFDQVKESSKKAGKELGVTVTWEAPTSSSADKQKEIIENLIKYQVNGILISCNDVDALKEPIQKAMAAGIKVGTFDSDCPGSGRTFYIGSDNKTAGKVCAETMNKLYQKAGKTPDNVIVIGGGPTADNLVQRLNGFKEAFGMKNLSNVLYSFEMPDVGKEILSLELEKNKKINGIQMVWGAMTLDGVEKIPALSKFVDDGGVVVFFDVSKPLLNYISKHPNCATMKQDFQTMGYEGVKNLYKAIKGEQFNPEYLINVKVIDQSNAAAEEKKL